MTNPQWPLIEEAIGFNLSPATPGSQYIVSTSGEQRAAGAPAESGLYVNVTARTLQAWRSTRGRQYELDQVQAGTASTVLDNTDGALDPSNSGSVYAPQVKMYRAYRRRAQWPVTVNMLLPEQVSYSAAFVPNYTLPRWLDVHPGVWDGQTGVPTSTPVGTLLLGLGGFAVTPGVPHSAQLRWTSPNATMTVGLQFNWYAPDGTVTVTAGTAGTTSSGQVTVTVTGTPPANCVGAVVTLTLQGALALTATNCSWDSAQLELAASPSAYAAPGVWYGMFSGFVSSWNDQWSDGGVTGTSRVGAVDAFGFLSQRKIVAPGYMDALYAGCSLFYPLDEPQNSPSFNDLTGNTGPMFPIYAGGAPVTQLVAGAQLPGPAPSNPNSIYSYGFMPASIPGPVVSFTNDGGTGAALLDLGTARGQVGPPSNSAWTMLFMVFMPYHASPQPAEVQTVWAVDDQTGQNSIVLYAQSGQYYVTVVKAGTVVVNGMNMQSGPYPVTANDGGWHLLMVTMSGDGKTLQTWVDTKDPAHSGNSITVASDMRPTFTAGAETLGGRLSAPSTPTQGFTGSLACVGYIPAVPTAGALNFDPSCADTPSLTLLADTLTSTQYGFAGVKVTPEASGPRFHDILRWGQWVGPQRPDNNTGGLSTQRPDGSWVSGGASTTQMAGPTEFLLTAASGTDVISALQTVTDTENGEQFVDVDGFVRFSVRNARYNPPEPVVVFGEGATGVERSNLCPNPSFDTALTGWVGSGATLARVTDGTVWSGHSMTVTGSGSPQAPYIQVPVTAGNMYAWTVRLDADGNTLSAPVFPCQITWLTSGGAVISTVTCAASSTQPEWDATFFPVTPMTVVGQAPATAAAARLQVAVGTLTSSDVVYVRACMFEQASSFGGSMFSGSGGDVATGAWTYQWVGAAGGSVSTMTAVEVPYTAVQPAFDLARLADDVALTQKSTGVVYRQTAAASVLGEYGDVQLARTVNTLDRHEISDAQGFLLGRYAGSLPRIDSVTVDVAATGCWGLALGLELGVPVRVMRRPPSPAVPVRFDGFVEQIVWNMTDAGGATVTLQLSSSAGLSFLQCDSPQFGMLDTANAVCGY